MSGPSKKTAKKTEPEGFQIYSKPLTIEADRPQVFECSTDRAEKVLLKYGAALADKKEWIAPLSLLLAFITALATADFKTALGVPGDIWGGAFLVGAVISAIWFVICIKKLWKYRGISVEVIVKKLYSDTDLERRKKSDKSGFVRRCVMAIKIMSGFDKA